MLANVALGSAVQAQSPRYSIEIAPLAATQRVAQGQIVLAQPVEYVEATGDLAVMTGGRAGNRTVWTVRSGALPERLSLEQVVPPDVNWFERVCSAGDRLVVAAGRYPEPQRVADRQAVRGDSVTGPSPAGLLIVSAGAPIYVEALSLAAEPPLLDASDRTYSPTLIPRSFAPEIQTCAWNGRELVIGTTGLLASIDLQAHVAHPLSVDLEKAFNRTGLYLDGPDTWVSLDSGGRDFECIRRLGPQRDDSYCILNMPDQVTEPNTILRHRGRLLVASTAGLAEIDEVHRRYVSYPYGASPEDYTIFGLRVVHGELWGGRPEGLVRFDLDRRAITVFKVPQVAQVGSVTAIAPFDGGWLVATRNAVLKVTIPDEVSEAAEVPRP